MKRCHQTIPSSHAAFPVEAGADIGIAHVRTTRLLVALLTLAIMLVLKRHYSLASAEALNWILAPTARLVAWLTPARPVFEHGVGHVDFGQGIIIAPACAGINFLIMAFGLSVCCGLFRLKTLKDLSAWLVLSLAVAYGYTLLVNTLRIGLSMGLYRADIYSGWLTAERLHRLTGVGLYLGALWLLYGGAQAAVGFFSRRPGHEICDKPENGPVWLPMVWYLAGTVGVPAINLFFQPRAPSFAEHCITLVAGSLGMWALATLTIRLLKRAN